MAAAQPAIKRGMRAKGARGVQHPTNIPSYCPALAENFESGCNNPLLTLVSFPPEPALWINPLVQG